MDMQSMLYQVHSLEYILCLQAGTMEIVQSNLRLIWKRLYTPELEQIDMAIKYSSNISTRELNKVALGSERKVVLFLSNE